MLMPLSARSRFWPVRMASAEACVASLALLARLAHETLHLERQVIGEGAVLRQQTFLPLHALQFRRAQFEPAAVADPELRQAGHHRRELLPGREVSERREMALHAPRARLEPVPHGLEQRPVRQVEDVRQDLRGHVRLRTQPRQAPVQAELLLDEASLPRTRRRAERPVTGHRVEQLIVDDGHQDGRQPRPQVIEFLPYPRAAVGKIEALGNGTLERLDVGDQRVRPLAHAAVLFALTHQLGQPPLEHDLFPIEFGRHHTELLAGRRGGQPRGRRHQRRALPGHAERRRHAGNAVLVHAVLGVAEAVERPPGHQARDQREGHGDADAGVELYRDPVPARREPPQAFAQPLRRLRFGRRRIVGPRRRGHLHGLRGDVRRRRSFARVRHRPTPVRTARPSGRRQPMRSARLSTARYRPSEPIMVRYTALEPPLSVSL